jgi:hypothetical protein
MKVDLNRLRVARTALLSVAVALVALAATAAPALAVTLARARIHGRGLTLPVQGSDTLSPLGVMVVVAVVVAAAAVSVVGWRRGRRSAAHSQQSGSAASAASVATKPREAPRGASMPSASKPLLPRHAAALARRDRRDDERRDKTTI